MKKCIIGYNLENKIDDIYGNLLQSIALGSGHLRNFIKEEKHRFKYEPIKKCNTGMVSIFSGLEITDTSLHFGSNRDQTCHNDILIGVESLCVFDSACLDDNIKEEKVILSREKEDEKLEI